MQIFDELHAFPWINPSANNCNTYFIDGDMKIIVDPGHEHLFAHVRENLARLSVTTDDIDLILITHTHPDHMEGVRAFHGSRALTAIHKTDWDYNNQLAAQYGEALAVPRFEPEIFLQEGDLRAGRLLFKIFLTPGHSPGSVCLYWPEKKVLFSGDVIFSGGIGRTDLPGGNGHILKKSIRTLSQLDVDILLPGHGDIVSGPDDVRANFEDIERVWFAYL